MANIANFPDGGWLGTNGLNEIEQVSGHPDPCKHRFAVHEGLVETNLGAVSWNTRRPSGVQDEWAYVMGRLTANRRGGAIYFATRPDGHQDTREVLYIDNSGAHFRVPIIAPNIGSGGGTGFPRKIALRSNANNRLVCAEGGGGQPLIANRDTVGAWETFDVIIVE